VPSAQLPKVNELREGFGDLNLSTELGFELPFVEIADVDKDVEFIYNSNSAGFHLSEISPTTICICGFKVMPDLNQVHAVLKQLGLIVRVKNVTTKPENAYKNHYVYVTFEDTAYNEEIPQQARLLVPQLKHNKNLFVIHRYSKIDQVFFGSVYDSINEQNMVDDINFGNLIHIEIKKRRQRDQYQQDTLPRKGTNYGFATMLDSEHVVKFLIDRRFFIIRGVKIEFKPKNKKGRQQSPEQFKSFPRSGYYESAYSFNNGMVSPPSNGAFMPSPSPSPGAFMPNHMFPANGDYSQMDSMKTNFDYNQNLPLNDTSFNSSSFATF
jgi:hypothetical protein